MRHVAPAWDEALNGGKESVACDLQGRAGARARPAATARTSCSRASGPESPPASASAPTTCPTSAVYCSITGFGADGPHVARAGHDLNYLGWAGVLEDTAPGLPPLQPADLAAGALGAVVEVLAARARARAHRPRRAADDLDDSRLAPARRAPRSGGDPLPRFLTGGLACYRIYATADDRWLTVGALEPKFFVRLCEVIGRPELAERTRPRGAGGARRRARQRRSPPAPWPTGCSSSTARTSASARWPRSRRAPRPSAREPACRPLASGSIRAHGGQNSASPDRSGARAAAAACRPGLGRGRVCRAQPPEARRLLARRRPLRR